MSADVGVMPQRDALELQIIAIAGNEPAGGLVEVRYKLTTGRGWGQLFHDCHRGKAIAETIQGLGQRTDVYDVYVGCAPRRHRHGGAEAIERVWVLWADLDTQEALDACSAFSPAPSVVIRSGTGRHAYWPLLKPLAPPHARTCLRRLAHTLGGDMASAEPARILRPAGTLNHKTDPPRPVVCERLELDAHNAVDVVGHLPDPPTPARPVRPTTPRAVDDPLLSIPADVYIEALTGRAAGHDNKARCPFHGGGEERTPSMHLYDDGWACFGACEPNPGRDHAGGGIIEFASRLYGIDPKGRGYRDIRRRLAADLLGSEA